jgi:hypothetical protein
MADLSDVLNLIYDQVADVIYPDGPLEQSIINQDVTIVKGWPIRNKLDDQLVIGKNIVSIFPTNKERISKVQTFRDWKDVEALPKTLSATIVNDNKVEISGTVSVPLSVMIIIDNAAYAYQVLESDSLNSIAFNLAQIIPGASSSGSTIQVFGSPKIEAKVIGQIIAGRELGRQEREFMISCWCPNVETRDQLFPPIDIFFRENYQFTLPDGFVCHFFYSHSEYSDSFEMQDLFRRDLFIKVMYASTSSKSYSELGETTQNIKII